MSENIGNGVREGKQVTDHNVGGDIVPECCTICQDPLDDTRTIVRLQCRHQFHLDCIGSAFNAKNMMQCPNCRNIEDGRWLFARGIGPQVPPMVNVAPIPNIAEQRQNDDRLVPQLPLLFHQNMSREPPAWLLSMPPITFGSFSPDYGAWMGAGDNGEGSSSGEGASGSGEGASGSGEGEASGSGGCGESG